MDTADKRRALLRFTSAGKSLTDITDKVQQVVQGSGVVQGLCHVFICHTSASLIIQENADPNVLHDLQHWMETRVPEGDAAYRHVEEGNDDPPSHIRTALTPPNLVIPVQQQRMMLGVWQGIFLWEHRRGQRQREVVVTVQEL